VGNAGDFFKPDGKIGAGLGVRPLGSAGAVFKPDGRAGTLDFEAASPEGKLGEELKPGGSVGVFVAGASPVGKGGAA